MSRSSELPPTPGWRSFGPGSALLVGGRLVAAVCGLIQVPVALQHLGTEAFGVWVALGGLLGTLPILDGGLGFALQNRIARELAGGRVTEATKLIETGARWLAGIGAAILVIGLPLAWWLPWPDWLGVRHDSLRAQMPRAVALAIGVGAVVLPLSLAARIASARQETWRIGAWNAIGSGVGLGAVLWGAHAGWTLTGFVAATALVPLVSHLGLILPAGRPAIAVTPSPSPALDVRSLVRESAWFLMPQIGAAFIGVFLPTLVALFAGAGAVAAFSVLQRLYGLVLQLQMLGLQPTWPAYTHAAERRDRAAAEKIMRGSLIASAATIVVLLLLVPITPTLLRWWLRSETPAIEPLLLGAIIGWHALQVLGQPFAMLLNGTGRNAAVAVAGWVMILAALGLCAWLGPAWGAAGVVIALIIPYAVINLPVAFVSARRALAAIGATAPAG